MRLSAVRRWAVRGAAAVLLVACLAYAGVYVVVDRVVSAHLHEQPSEVPPAAVILVPAAEVYPNGRPSPALASRLDGALALYRLGKAPALLMSGGNGNTEVQAMETYARARGLPASAILLDPNGARTLDSCHNTRSLMPGRVIIVTQADHLRRAVYICREIGLDAEGLVVADFTGPKFWIYWARERPALVLAWWQTAVLGER